MVRSLAPVSHVLYFYCLFSNTRMPKLCAAHTTLALCAICSMQSWGKCAVHNMEAILGSAVKMTAVPDWPCTLDLALVWTGLFVAHIRAMHTRSSTQGWSGVSTKSHIYPRTAPHGVGVPGLAPCATCSSVPSQLEVWLEVWGFQKTGWVTSCEIYNVRTSQRTTVIIRKTLFFRVCMGMKPHCKWQASNSSSLDDGMRKVSCSTWTAVLERKQLFPF